MEKREDKRMENNEAIKKQLDKQTEKSINKME